jgi:hypothetical protein
MSNQITLVALRKTSTDLLVNCGLDHEDATIFRVTYPGRVYQEETVDFTSKYTAEHVVRALHRTFKSGQEYSKAKIREVLGC